MASKQLCTFLLAASLSCLAQAGPSQEVPRLLAGADLPRYPPLAAAAHFTGRVTVRVSVENGKVAKTEIVSAEVRDRSNVLVSKAASQWLTGPTMENLKSWRFNTDVNDTFVVNYTYEISGTETDGPTNPRVEIFPSLDVKITARPVKPTVEY